jgi:hypothetical protein
MTLVITSSLPDKAGVEIYYIQRELDLYHDPFSTSFQVM